jgi:hypothetical protein
MMVVTVWLFDFNYSIPQPGFIAINAILGNSLNLAGFCPPQEKLV